MNYFIVICIISALILLHELGHYMAARQAGIPIEVFSVGYGPALWKKKIGVTEFRLSMVPLGGYVLPAIRDQEEYFRIPAHRRALFALGGPTANFILVLLLFASLNTAQDGFTLNGAFVEPFRQTWLLAGNILSALSGFFKEPDKVSGIVGILHQGSVFIGDDPSRTARLALILSANLAVFNLIPLPVLDGGKVLLCVLEKISVRLRAAYVPLMAACWIIIIGLMVYATIIDIGRLTAHAHI
ncbi:MAG: site-2 protease family protein [Spirochaetes bacterium]|nr:site-2 protease family protein [Spirochaetota bacterium]